MSEEIAHLCQSDPVMARLIMAAGPYELKPDLKCAPFQALAGAITHQQLNGTAAKTILGRFVDLCGRRGKFPQPKIVLATPDSQLRAAGLSFSKIAALKDLATKTIEGVVPGRAELDRLSNDEIIERLTSVRGIGR